MTRSPGPPPWWPEDEAWPPEDWRLARRRFAPRIAALLFGLSLLGLIACFLVFAIYWGVWQGPSGRERHWGPAPFGGIIVLLILGLLAFRVLRSLRVNALALDDIAREIDRIASGDYDVQLPERGWPETQQLSRSVMSMAARLREAEAQRIALQADVAHELRTPLSVIQGTTEGMIDGVYPRNDEHLELILRRTRMMTELLEDFRTISTAEAGALRLHRAQIDIAELLDTIITDHRAEAARKGVIIEKMGAETLVADVDPVRFAEVIDNLVENALRHTSDGDRIELGVERLEPELQVWVRDTGTGIPRDQLPIVFDRYAKSADSGGSGLGLAIAKRLVEAHGGSISVDSVEGQGAKFTTRIPAQQSI
jgi:two-component system sensor histidine kinase BaeS